MKKIEKIKKTRKSLQASAGSKQTSFLPEPEFNPVVPRKDTLAYKALSLMLKGKRISHPDFQGVTNSWRLAAYIDALNKLGWPVLTIDVTHETSERRVSISLYFLDKGIIDKFKKLSGGAK